MESITLQKISELRTTRDFLKGNNLNTEEIDNYIKTLLPDAIKELETNITDIQDIIDNIRIIEVPAGVREEVAFVIEKSNEFPIGEKFMFEAKLQEKKDLLNELKVL